MNQAEMDDILRQTLEDHRLSRSEKRALGEVLSDLAPAEADLAWLRNRAFELARLELKGRENGLVLDWLEQVVKVMAQAAGRGKSDAEPRVEAYFTPGQDAAGRIVRLFRSARRRIDVCVFTITDNRIAAAIEEAHRRGVDIRVITDDDKAYDRGSDVDRIADAGVPVRTDNSDHHMHNKFALFDGTLLVTGSYNWTRGAAQDNQENLVILEEPRLVKMFSETFEGLWEQFG